MATAGGESSEGDPEGGNDDEDVTDELLIAAKAARPAPRLATRHDGGISTASRPQKFTCDDNRLYAVKFVQNGHGDGRGVATEQIVGLLGDLIEAPVPPVALIEVPQPMIDELRRDKAAHHLDFDPAAGVHHGSRWAHNYSGRAGLEHLATNRTRFGALDVLYTWVSCAGDHQWIYSNDPTRAVLSVDHTMFLPGGFAWSAADLAASVATVTQDPMMASLGLTAADRAESIRKLEDVTPADIATIVSRPPDDWGVDDGDRAALARFLLARKDAVVSLLS